MREIETSLAEKVAEVICNPNFSPRSLLEWHYADFVPTGDHEVVVAVKLAGVEIFVAVKRVHDLRVQNLGLEVLAYA